jgi:hypothetical protein
MSPVKPSHTISPLFPTMNPLQPAFSANYGNSDAFVAKVNPAGAALVYSTYLGGSGGDGGSGIAYGLGIGVDSSGNAYVTGATFSTDFPTMNPLQPALTGNGNSDAFVAKLNSTGSALVYSTYLGGSGGDQVRGIAVDDSGNAYVTGNTDSTNFPTNNPLQPAFGGLYDAFVAKISLTSGAVDNIPPTSTATPSPGPNSNGRNNTNVTVNLNAADNPGGSGVKQIQFASQRGPEYWLANSGGKCRFGNDFSRRNYHPELLCDR